MNYKAFSLMILAASLSLPAFAAGKTPKDPASPTAAKQAKHKKHKGADKMAPATTPAPAKH